MKHFRPRVESKFLEKLITEDMETNVLGLPSGMIIPEAIQRRGSRRNAMSQEPLVKVRQVAFSLEKGYGAL